MPSPEHPGLWTVRPLWGVLFVAVVLRLGAALYLGNVVTPQPGIFDELSYHTLATRVLEGHGFTFGTGWWPATQPGEPTAHWSYLYVLLLAGLYALAGPAPLAARLIQAIVCGLLQPLLTYKIAGRLFGPRVALAASAVAAGYAYFIYYAGALVTESLYILAILWAVHMCLEMADRARRTGARPGVIPWMGLGLALAAAVLLRQVVLLLVPAIVAWAGWQIARRASDDDRWFRRRAAVAPGMAAAISVVVLAMAPWIIRNHRAFGEFVPLNTNAGFALFWGNHPTHGTSFVPILPGPEYGTLIPPELDGLNEAELDRALLRQAVGFVRDDPFRVAWLSLSRMKEYFKFWPSEESGRLSNAARVLSFGLCLPFLIAGVALGVRSRAPDDSRSHPGVWLLLGIALGYSIIHFLTWTLVRYRLPVDAILMPFAGLAIVRAHLYCTRWSTSHLVSPPVAGMSR